MRLAGTTSQAEPFAIASGRDYRMGSVPWRCEHDRHLADGQHSVRLRWLWQTVDLKLKIFVRAERTHDALYEFPDCVHRVALPDADTRCVVRRRGMDRQLDVRG